MHGKKTLMEFMGGIKGANLSVVDTLVNLFKNRPPATQLYAPEALLAECYKKQIAGRSVDVMLKLILERVLPEDEFGPRIILLESGDVRAEDRAQTMFFEFLRRKYFGYQKFGVGSCSDRSGYAAVQLFAALPTESDVKVSWYSYPKKDQYVVAIRSSPTELYIFDPLFDPEHVYLSSRYSTDILRKLPDAEEVGPAARLMMTPEIQQQVLAASTGLLSRSQEVLSPFLEKNVEEFYRECMADLEFVRACRRCEMGQKPWDEFKKAFHKLQGIMHENLPSEEKPGSAAPILTIALRGLDLEFAKTKMMQLSPSRSLIPEGTPYY